MICVPIYIAVIVLLPLVGYIIIDLWIKLRSTNRGNGTGAAGSSSGPNLQYNEDWESTGGIRIYDDPYSTLNMDIPPRAPQPRHLIYDNVALALSTPGVLVPKNNYTIKFIAYLEKDEYKITTLLKDLSPQNTNLLNLDFCKWKVGTKITVRLYSDHLNVEQATQTFEWLGKHKIVNFDVQVSENAPIGKLIDVKADVLIRGLVIGRLRCSIKIGLADDDTNNTVKGKPYDSAFASYAREDSDLVIGRLSEIERNGVSVFFDRMRLHSGELWKEELDAAIKNTQVFLLFWSANAKKSRNVEWEWKTALKHKGLTGIEPHPLENPQLVEPPNELKSLHFDDKYLYFKNKK